MEAKAVLRYIHLSPRKARQAIDLIRGYGVNEALSILTLTPKRSARVVEKVVKSALANAEEKKVEDIDALVISKAWVDPGPTVKRFMPRARGRATPIRKRTSHIAIVLSND